MDNFKAKEDPEALGFDERKDNSKVEVWRGTK